MTSALILVVYTLFAGTVLPRAVQRRGLLRASPRLAIAAWHALILSVVLAALSSGLSLTLGLTHVSTDIASLVDLCASSVKHNYAPPGGGVASLAGLAVFAVLSVRLAWAATRIVLKSAMERRRTVRTLDVVGRRNVVRGALVIEHGTPYAFCVPGRRPRVVLTSALVTSLTGEQIRAVTAHERAHLAQRHHLALILSQAASEAFFDALPLFRIAEQQIAQLIEVCADDTARRRVGALPLREALSRLTWNPASSVVLAATASGVEDRLARLDAPRYSLTLGRTFFTGAAVGLAALTTIAIAAAPAVATAWDGLCLIA